MSDIEEIQTTGAGELTVSDMREMAEASREEAQDDIRDAGAGREVDASKIAASIRKSDIEAGGALHDAMVKNGMTMDIVDEQGVKRLPDLTNPDDIKMFQEQKGIEVSAGQTPLSEWEMEYRSLEEMRVKETSMPEGHTRMFPLFGGERMSTEAMYQLMQSESFKLTGVVSVVRPKLLHLLYPLRLPASMSSFTVMCMYSAAIRVLASPAIVPKAMETAVNALSSNPDTVITPDQFDIIVNSFVPSSLPLVSDVGLVQPKDYQLLLLATPREQKTMQKLTEALGRFRRPSYQGVNRAIFNIGVPFLDIYRESAFYEDMSSAMIKEGEVENRLVLARIVGLLDTDVGEGIRKDFGAFVTNGIEDRFRPLLQDFVPKAVPGRTEIDLDELELVMRGSVIHALHAFERCIMNLLAVMAVTEVDIPPEERGKLMTPLSFPPANSMSERAQKSIITMARHNMSHVAYVSGITDVFVMARDAFTAPTHPALEADGSFLPDKELTVSMGVVLQENETNSLLIPASTTLSITTGDEEKDAHYFDGAQMAIDAVMEKRDRIDESRAGFIASGDTPEDADQKAADLVNPERAPPPPIALAAAWPPVLRKAMADIFMANADDVLHPERGNTAVLMRAEVLRSGMWTSNLEYMAKVLAAQVRSYMKSTRNEAERVAKACEELGYSADDLLRGARSTTTDIISEQLGIATSILGLKPGDPMIDKIMANIPEKERVDVVLAISDTSSFFRAKAAEIMGPDNNGHRASSKRGMEDDDVNDSTESADGSVPPHARGTDTGDIDL